MANGQRKVDEKLTKKIEKSKQSHVRDQAREDLEKTKRIEELKKKKS